MAVKKAGWGLIAAGIVLSLLIRILRATVPGLLTFFWAAMRYAEDFMPELVLLSIIGFWQGYQLLGRHPGRGKMYALPGAILAFLSITTAILLALSLYSSSALL